MTENGLLFLLLATILLTGLCLMFYMYKLVLIDAESRKIDKPKLWAFLAATSQNGSGLPFYLFKRRGTMSYLSVEDQKKVAGIKRKIYALLFFDVIVFILTVIIL